MLDLRDAAFVYAQQFRDLASGSVKIVQHCDNPVLAPREAFARVRQIDPILDSRLVMHCRCRWKLIQADRHGCFSRLGPADSIPLYAR
jgi:hypothetical protein